MATNVFKEKERQETLIYVFFFLIIFSILIWLFPPSFKISTPMVVQERIEKRDHEMVIGNLEKINPENYGEFSLIDEFDGDPGRENPFTLEAFSFEDDEDFLDFLDNQEEEEDEEDEEGEEDEEERDEDEEDEE